MARKPRTKSKRKTSARRRKSKYSKRKSTKRVTRRSKRTKRRYKTKRRSTRKRRYSSRALDDAEFALWANGMDVDGKPNYRPAFTGGTTARNDIQNESKVDGQGFYGLRGRFGKTRLRFGL